jgi:hypothetical protein
MIPRIESIHGLEDFDFIEMPWRDMIQDSEEVRMEGLCRHCVGTYGGVYDLSAKQVGAHSSSMVDAVFGQGGEACC